MAGVDGIHEVVLNLARQQFLRVFHVLDEELHAFLNAFELIFDGDTLFLHESLEVLYLVFRQGEHHLSLERNGVSHVSAVPLGETRAHFRHGLANQAHHLLVGICATLVDFEAGVSATQAFESNLYGCLLIVVYGLVFEC